MYKVGDKVRVRSRGQIGRTLNSASYYEFDEPSHPFELFFNSRMYRWCGEILEIQAIEAPQRPGQKDFYVLKDLSEWSWVDDWLEPMALDNRRIDNV